MGGLAFKQKLGIESKRLDNKDYLIINSQVSDVLSKFFTHQHTLKSFEDKISHGDLDKIVSGILPGIKNWKTEFSAIFNNAPIHNNGNVTSFLINNFQVDITTHSLLDFESACFYSDFDPRGNLFGKLYHLFNIRFGHDGLSYILKENNNTYKLGKIFISRDSKKICEFLGLDPSINNFKTQEDIFDYIISSKYFDAKIFSFDEMNHAARTRDRKRSSYNNFMNYIKDYSHKTYDWPLRKSDWLETINDFFPESNLIKRIGELKMESAKTKERKMKFSGSDIIYLTGKSGAEIGEIINYFKDYVNKVVYYGMDLTYEDYIDRNSKENIYKGFINWYTKNYQKNS